MLVSHLNVLEKGTAHWVNDFEIFSAKNPISLKNSWSFLTKKRVENLIGISSERADETRKSYMQKNEGSKLGLPESAKKSKKELKYKGILVSLETFKTLRVFQIIMERLNRLRLDTASLRPKVQKNKFCDIFKSSDKH